MTGFSLGFPFSAAKGAYGGTDTRIDRLLKARLSANIINIRDRGAVGDGITDDGPALADAISYAMSLNAATFNRGAVVWFPAGDYWIDPSHFPIFLELFPDSGSVQMIGAGREATRIFTNFSTNGNGYYYVSDTGAGTSQPMFYTSGPTCQLWADMTIENQSPNFDAMCIVTNGTNQSPRFSNIHFKSPRGLAIEEDAFGTVVESCLFTNPVAIGAANSGTIGPLTKSCGLYFSQGVVENCQFQGFDVGLNFTATVFFQHGNIGLSQDALIASNLFYRCNSAFSNLSTATGVPFGSSGVAGMSIMACQADRCNRTVDGAMDNTRLAGLAMTGREGPCDGIPITSVSWSSGTVTVQTVTGSLTNGSVVQLIGIETGADNACVTVSGVTSTHFSYALGHSPATKSRITWNRPMQYGLAVRSPQRSRFAASALLAPTQHASFEWRNAGTSSGDASGPTFCTFMATAFTYGWSDNAHNTDSSQGAGVDWPGVMDFISCDAPGIGAPPRIWKHGADLANIPYLTEREEIITDGTSILGFGALFCQILTLATDVANGASAPTLHFATVPTTIQNGMSAVTGTYTGGTGGLNGNLVTSVSPGSPGTVTLDGSNVRLTPAGTPIMFSWSAYYGTNQYKVRNRGDGSWIRIG